MLSIFNEFQSKLNKKSIKTQNTKFDEVIKKFFFDIFIEDKKDFTYFLKKINISHTIIIDKYIENESAKKYGDNFYIVCFEYSLFIIQSKIFSDILLFLIKSKDSTIYCCSEQIEHDIQQLTKNIRIHFSRNNFFNKISNYLDEFNVYIDSDQKKKEIKDFWITIRRSLVGFLLMKSYINSIIDRTDQNQFKKLFQKNPKTFKLHKSDYIKLKSLGSGSSSRVYLIYHIEQEKIYALKVFYNHNDESEKLYERELYNYNHLSHPFFPRFYGTLQEGGYKCLVIEYIEGETLEKRKDMGIYNSICTAIDILKIIEYIHNNKFIYRDLKTNNLIVNGKGEIFLIDFDRMIHLEKKNQDDENIEITKDLMNTSPEMENFGIPSFSHDTYFLAKNIFKNLFLEEHYQKYPTLLRLIQKIIDYCSNENPNLRPKIPEIINNYYLIIGVLYSYGYGVKQDYDKAKEYYELSAKQNNSDAFNNLGELYEKGYGVKQDYNKAKEYYELSAKQNNSDAFNNLGELYFNGYGVKQDYNKAIKYYELSAKQNNSKAFNYLGHIYANGFGVKRDYSTAKKYFLLSIQQNYSLALLNMGNLYRKEKDYLKAKTYYELSIQKKNSDSLCKIGNLYLKGRGVKIDYLKAKEYYEESADRNNSNALYKLGKLYFHGQGVKQDYDKAIKYYELSGRQGNWKALFEIGNLYFEGKGIESNYYKAKKYYEMSTYNNNPDGFFFLGVFYSRGDIFEINISLAIQYFSKSIKFHFDQARINNNVDHFYDIKRIYNNYYYHSQNELGLIYLIHYNDIEKATKHIKEAAFGEYPFGQNNFGLTNEIYFNEIENAEYMYKRSSEHNFALAFYNLGHLKEKENEKAKQESDEYIEYYKKASETEDCPLIFHEHQHNDKRLEISKTFIICMINLKLCEYYFNKNDNDESKKYFTRSIKKLLKEQEYLIIEINREKDNANYFFSYLKNFILSFPSFNLANQPNFDLNIDFEDSITLNYNHEFSSTEKQFTIEKNGKEYSTEINEFLFMKKHVKEKKSIELKGIKEKVKIGEEEYEDDHKIIKIFKEGSEIFDFIISNENYKNIFCREIKKIIQIMNEIIYTPPYHILFGRISITKPKQKKERNPNKKEINELFYEGFGLDELKTHFKY
ncbi:hypothetical protein M9Y10_039655 [Tritrichomonas musculus]|uniref:Protein kinase domain-containing protein n=1 Tax=Tritrichomonas musculus TaxID=1915356 RepID=A0ABR2GQV8_9EUKA